MADPVHPLMSKHARMFQHGAPAVGFSLPSGWTQLMDDALKEISGLLDDAQAKGFRIDQVKEKFAALRVYWLFTGDNRPGREAVGEVIGRAAAASRRTCQNCGAPGEERSGGWRQTLCDRHALENECLSEFAERCPEGQDWRVAFEAWCSAPVEALGGQLPVELLQTAEGGRQVLQALKDQAAGASAL